MILSFALIMLGGLAASWLFRKLQLPGLFGMILVGILIGPSVLGLIDSSVLAISADIRKIALIVILIRAGLSLNLADLKKVGRPAVLMCFVPACFEMLGYVIAAPIFLGLTYMEAAILGAVIAAVSPAVVVPRMIRLINEGYGTREAVPQLILASASVDDVFVIVMFTAFTGLAQGENLSVMSFINIPLSVLTGIAVGALVGYILTLYFSKIHMRDTMKVIIFLGVSFLMVSFENEFGDAVPFASLIAVMFSGMMIKLKKEKLAERLSAKYNKIWQCAEVFLFVLLGSAVSIEYLGRAGFKAAVLILLVLVFRMLGVFVCLIRTKLNSRERLFCMIAYTPKATVQAAIGGMPLAMGLACGETVLACAVIAIMLTAPIGAFFIDLSYKMLLRPNK